MIDLNQYIEKYWDEITAHRHYLHAHPEHSGQEQNTANYIASALRKIGIEPKENIGGYGVTAVIKGNGNGKCVGLRADIDALEIQEETGVSYASQSPGIMHACGHDVHAAMLLGAARILTDIKDTFSGAVKLIFQPSEEDTSASGAKAMIADGCLNNPNVDAVFAQHVWPTIPIGHVAARANTMHGASDKFYLTVHGKSSHGGASPHKGVDAIIIAAQIISALQSIISRNVNPFDGCVLTIGTIQGGTRYNIIPDTVVMEGTCRTLTTDLQKQVIDQITKIATGVAQSMGGTCDVDYRIGYGVTANTKETYLHIKKSVELALGEDAFLIPEHPTLGGEDFSFYSHKVPCGIAWLGCKTDEQPDMSLHSSTFLPSDEVMRTGVAFLVSAAINYLKT